MALPIANAQSQIRFCGIGLFLRNSKETPRIIKPAKIIIKIK